MIYIFIANYTLLAVTFILAILYFWQKIYERKKFVKKSTNN